MTCSSVAPTTRTTSAMRTTLSELVRPIRWRATTSMRPLDWPRPRFFASRAANTSTAATNPSDRISRRIIQVMR
nr:hypothetical protein [Blastococcus sp. TML/M2B]